MAGGSSFSDGYVDSLMRIRNGDERIHMLGYVYGDLLEELFSNAYLIVQPSFLEGLSISLVEAMSHGKAILASDIPENLEVIEDCGDDLPHAGRRRPAREAPASSWTIPPAVERIARTLRRPRARAFQLVEDRRSDRGVYRSVPRREPDGTRIGATPSAGL